MHAAFGRHYVRAFLAVLLFVASFPSAAANVRNAAEPMPGRYIVVLSPLTADVSVVARQLSAQYGGTVLGVWKHAVKGFWIEMPAANAERLATDRRVEKMETDAVVHTSGSGVQNTGPSNPPPGGQTTWPYANDPLWHLTRISHREPNPALKQYAYRHDGTGVTVYLVDAGVWANHQEFSHPGRIAVTEGHNAGLTPTKHEFVGKKVLPVPIEPDDSFANDPCSGDERFPSNGHISHGTACAGLVVGRYTGVAKGVDLVPVTAISCLRGENVATSALWISALDWVLGEIRKADNNPAVNPAVVSMSTFRFTEGPISNVVNRRCGTGKDDCLAMPDLSVLEEIVHQIVQAGVPVIVSANNQGDDACLTTPARLSARGGFRIGGTRTGVISVGATTPADTRREATPEASNYGQCVDIWAPGENIVVPEPVLEAQPVGSPKPVFTAYRTAAFTGTSFSAPIVAGVVARMMEEDPTLYSVPAQTAARVLARLQANATRLTANNLGVGSPDGLVFLSPEATFTDAPRSQTVLDGSTVTLNAPVAGGGFTYQWYSESGPISGATSSSYSLTVSLTEHGNQGKEYWIRATRIDNPSRFVETARARIRASLVDIKTHPVSVWPSAGQTPTLTATVRPKGTEQYRVQWQRLDVYPYASLTPASFTGSLSSGEQTVQFNATGPVLYRLAVLPASCTQSACVVYSDTARVGTCDALPTAPALEIGSLVPSSSTKYQIDLMRPTANCANPEVCKLDSAIKIDNGSVFSENTKYRWDWSPDPNADHAALGPLFISHPRTRTEVPPSDMPPYAQAPQYVYEGERIWPPKPGAYSVRAGNECTTSPASSIVRIQSVCTFDFLVWPPDATQWQTHDTIEQKTSIVPSGKSVCLSVQLTNSSKSPDPPYVRVNASWSPARPPCNPAPDGSTSSLSTDPVTGPQTYTFTGYDPISGCKRELVFNVSDKPMKKLVAVAGECQFSSAPKLVKKQNAQLTLRAKPQSGVAGVELPADLAGRITYIWSVDGVTKQEKLGSENGAVFKHTVNYLTAKDVVVTLRPPDDEWSQTSVTIHIEPRSAACTSYECVSLCKRRAVRRFGMPTTFHAFTPGETSTLGAPEEAAGYTYEWHRMRDGGPDELIGFAGSIDVVMNDSARYWVVTNTGTEQFESDTLTTVPGDMHSGDVTITPAYQVVTTGEPATVQVTFAAANADTRYQWRSGGSYDLSAPILGAGPALTIADLPDDTVLWCLVIETDETTRATILHYSPFATVIVNCSPSMEGWISVTPQRVARNQDAKLTIATSAAKFPTFSWLKRMPDGSTQTAGSSAVLRTTVTQPVTHFGAIMTDVCGNSTTIAEKPVYLCVPTIDQQPAAHQIVKPGQPVTVALNASPAIAGQPVTVTWHRSGYNNGSAPPIVGSGPSFSPTIAEGTTETYYAIVSSPCADSENAAVYSQQATVEVCSRPVITGHSPDRYLTYLEATTIVVLATGTELTYQWYEGTSGNTSKPLAGWTDNDQEFTPSRTTSYWCRVTSRGVCTTDSAAITVHVCWPPEFVAQPQSTNVFSGGTATLSVTVDDRDNTDPLTYQWQRLISADTWENIAGATNATFTTPALTANTTYRVQVTVGDCRITSVPATVSICTYPAVIDANPAETKTAVGQEVTLRVLLSPAYSAMTRWYEGDSGIKTTYVGGGMGATLTVAPQSTKKYWAEIDYGGCTSRTTNYTVRVCKPTITSNPAASSIAAGQSTTVTVGTTTLAGQTFQWYTGTAGTTTSPLTGQTSATLTVSPAATTSYWVRVTGTCGTFVDSTAATVTVCNPPGITALAQNRFIQAGTSTTLSVSATGTNLTYKWYVGTSGTTTNPVANGTASSITVSPSSTTNYWVQIKSNGICVTNSATVNVDVCTTPVITTPPQSQTIRIGQSATLSVTTSATGATHQWYQGAPGVTTTPLGTTSSINVTPAADTQYWVRVTRGACSADSTATITVCKLTASVANVNAASGVNATLTASVANARGTLTHWWYRGNSGDTSVLAAAGAYPQITVSRTANTNYWVRVTDGTCTIDSATATLNICVPAISTHPQNAGILGGQTATLSVTATGSPLTYQWYTGDSGVTTSPIPGATAATYTTPALTANAKYWVRVTGCGTANSTTATVTVCAPPNIPSPPTKSGGLYAGNTGTLSVSATGTGLTYQWYKGQSGDTTRPISGATAATYSFTLSVSEYYWVRVTGTCGSANSAAILYSVTPAITVQPQSVAVPYGSRPTLSVTATGNFLTYQWYLGPYANSPIAGATSATYQTPQTTGTTTYWVKVSSGTTSVSSSQITVTPCNGPSVGFTSTYLGSHSWRLMITTLEEADMGRLVYEWYIGTPGDVTQSVLQGGSTYYRNVNNLTQSQTWWARVWYDDGSCYTDTQGLTIY